MKRLSFIIITYGFLVALPIDQVMADAEAGKEFFNNVQGGNCRTCHSTKNTKIVGPGLKNIMVRHSEEWVRLFITDPQKTWEMDHPETLDLKKRVRGMKSQYARCRKTPMTEENKDNLIDYFKTLTVKE